MATIPKGEWLCRVCAAGDEQAKCVLCPVKGGALKRVRPGNSSWAHLCCALWIPEVRVGNADKMEPITNIDGIPVSVAHLVTPCDGIQFSCQEIVFIATHVQ